MSQKARQWQKMMQIHNNIDPSNTAQIRAQYSKAWQQRVQKAGAALDAELGRRHKDERTPAARAQQLAAFWALAYERLVVAGGAWQRPYIAAGYEQGLDNADAALLAAGALIAAREEVLARAQHEQAIAAAYGAGAAALYMVGDATAQQLRARIEAAYAGGADLDTVRSVAQDRVQRVGQHRAALAVGWSIVGLAADGVLNRMVDFGITLVSAVAEAKYTTADDERVCPQCIAYEVQDNGSGPGVYTIEQARGIIPVHFGCRCSWQPVLLGFNVPLVRI